MKIYKVILFKTKNGEYCWRVVARNGRELFRASTPSKNKTYMTEQAECIRDVFEVQ